jgi:hypothetical protein
MVIERPSQAEINKALQIAYNRIKSNKTSYICLALPNNNAGSWIKTFIHESLDEYLFVSTWITMKFCNGIRPPEEVIKQYRLAWIKYMMDQ